MMHGQHLRSSGYRSITLSVGLCGRMKFCGRSRGLDGLVVSFVTAVGADSIQGGTLVRTSVFRLLLKVHFMLPNEYGFWSTRAWDGAYSESSAASSSGSIRTQLRPLRFASYSIWSAFRTRAAKS